MLGRGVKQIFKIGIGLGSSFVLLYIAALLSLRISGFEYAVVVSNSMQPHTSRGDLVILTEPTTPTIGDVVTFQRGATTVLHRLVHRTEEGAWKTKGDSNPTPDPWRIDSSEIEARAVGRLAGFGWPLIWFDRGSGETGANAVWNNSASRVGAVTSKTLTSTSYKLWTRYSSTSFHNNLSEGGLRILYSGERRLYSRFLCPNLCRIHFEGYLSKIDPAVPQFDLMFNSCPTSSDGITCGWVVRFVNGEVQLRLISSSGLVSGVLDSCALPSNHALSLNSVYSISKYNSGFLITWNGFPCRLGESKLSTYPDSTFPTPTGSEIGFWISGTNSFSSSRTNVR